MFKISLIAIIVDDQSQTMFQQFSLTGKRTKILGCPSKTLQLEKWYILMENGAIILLLSSRQQSRLECLFQSDQLVRKFQFNLSDLDYSNDFIVKIIYKRAEKYGHS